MVTSRIALILMATFWLGSMPLAHAALFGPGKFEILQADGRFDESGNVVLSSRNNQISKKSIVGGTHMDANGVYVNPTVRRDSQSGQIVELGLDGHLELSIKQ